MLLNNLTSGFFPAVCIKKTFFLYRKMSSFKFEGDVYYLAVLYNLQPSVCFL